MKKSILFVIDSLICAGAEKSLVTLLSSLDYTQYSVDLMLFSHGEMLEEFVPKEVNILKPLRYTTFTKLNVRESFISSLKEFNFSMFYTRMKFSARIRVTNCDSSEKARIYWEYASKNIENNDKEYEVAIAYSQGIPTFYVASKVKAKKKYAWVNIGYRLKEKEKELVKKYYDRFDKIIAVSDSAKEIFIETLPIYKNKVEVIYDINNPTIITAMSKMEDVDYDNFDGVKILTIGRLVPQKGYDIALDACLKLKKKRINFKWYALGTGPLKNEIEQFIHDHNLQENFILLGVKSNPYPYIKNADIYVQPSKFEGFGLAIAEARILNIPVVTTRFDAVYNQMVEGKNGIVVDMNGEAVCDAIMELINNDGLRHSIVSYLKQEKKGNVEEIEKFYQLIN